MNTMTINDFILYLESLPEEKRDKEIWYVDISYPRKGIDDINTYLDEDRIIVSN